MKHTGPFAQLAEAAGKARMRSLVEETKYAQAKVDHAELGEFLERTDWMIERLKAIWRRGDTSIGPCLTNAATYKRALEQYLATLEKK